MYGKRCTKYVCTCISYACIVAGHYFFIIAALDTPSLSVGAVLGGVIGSLTIILVAAILFSVVLVVIVRHWKYKSKEPSINNNSSEM